MKYFPLVWRSLMRRKLRTLFTALSIVVAFVLFGALMALKAAFGMGVDLAGQDRLVMIQKVSFIQPLPRAYQNRIAASPGVASVTHQSWFGGIYQDPKNFFAQFAVEPEPLLQMYPEFVLPADQKKAWLANRTGAIVGRATADRFGWKVGDRVPLISPIYRKPDGTPWEFTIEGIYTSPVKGTDKTQFLFHYDYPNEVLRNFPQVANQVGWYVIKVSDPNQSDVVAKRIDALFANSSAETKTATEKAFISDFANQVGDIGAIMVAIASIVMFFILFVAGNAMAQSIRERTSELAVLKTLGFRDGLILVLVLIESSVIAVLGGGLGLAVAWIIIAQGDPTGGFLQAFYFPPRDLALGIALVFLLGIGTGLLPAVQAQRLKIVTALRRA
jgi:putative ABC transport system permease protein